MQTPGGCSDFIDWGDYKWGNDLCRGAIKLIIAILMCVRTHIATYLRVNKRTVGSSEDPASNLADSQS